MAKPGKTHADRCEHRPRRLLGAKKPSKRGPRRDATIRVEVPYCPKCFTMDPTPERTSTKSTKPDDEGVVVEQQRRCLVCGHSFKLFINLVAAPAVPKRDRTPSRPE